MPVEVSGILAQHSPKVPLTEDQDPVGAFGACGAYPPFGEGVRSRRPWRDLEHPGVVAGQHIVEDPDELCVPVANQETERARPVLPVDEEVAGLLGDPGTVGVGGVPWALRLLRSRRAR
jgi:hypothetical protein